MTDYRKGLYKLTPYDKETAAATLDILEEFAQKCRAEYGRSVIYPSDEWYLTAERPLPPAEFYDAFAQLEDGVGMWRLYHDTFWKNWKITRVWCCPTVWMWLPARWPGR